MLPSYKIAKSNIDHFSQHGLSLFNQIKEMATDYDDFISRFMTIPSISDRNAIVILSEIDNDWSCFSDAKHFCSWVGIALGNHESVVHHYRTGITKGNKYIRKVIIKAAQSTALTKIAIVKALANSTCICRQRRSTRQEAVFIVLFVLTFTIPVRTKRQCLYFKDFLSDVLCRTL